MRKKESKILLFAGSLLFLATVLFGITYYLDQDKILYKDNIPIFIEISNVTGLKVENKTLDFGSIIPGAYAGKTLNLINNYDFPVLAEFIIEGQVKDMIIVDPIVRFGPFEKKEIKVYTEIIERDKPYGNYTGTLKVVFKKD